MDIRNNKVILSKLTKISKKYNLSILILFGSRANGSYKKNSDYDFAFMAKKPLLVEEEINLFNDIMELLGNENIDLINISTNTSAKLRYEIFFKGIPLYESSSLLFKELKGRAYIDYIDFKRYNKNGLERIKKRIEELDI